MNVEGKGTLIMREKTRGTDTEPHTHERKRGRSRGQQASSITGFSGMGGWNKWTGIAHNPSSELNHFALQGALVNRFSH